jgi:hypothetical protein
MCVLFNTADIKAFIWHYLCERRLLNKHLFPRFLFFCKAKLWMVAIFPLRKEKVHYVVYFFSTLKNWPIFMKLSIYIKPSETSTSAVLFNFTQLPRKCQQWSHYVEFSRTWMARIEVRGDSHTWLFLCVQLRCECRGTVLDRSVFGLYYYVTETYVTLELILDKNWLRAEKSRGRSSSSDMIKNCLFSIPSVPDLVPTPVNIVVSFLGDKFARVWGWPLTFKLCRGQENVDICIRSPYVFMTYWLVSQTQGQFRCL